MTAPHHELATKFLVAQTTNASEPHPPPAPAAMVAAAARALRQRAEARRRRTWLLRLSLAASVLILVGAGVLLRQWTSTRATPQPAESREWLALAPTAAAVPGETRWLPEGAHIRTDSATTTLSFHEVTHVSVHARSDVELVLQGRTNVLRLDQGSLSARVKKLTPDERFIVRTVDAEVEVRGTVFHVNVVPSEAACGEGTTTRVSVDEGTVVVRRAGQEHAVHAGEAWPNCPSTRAMLPSPVLDASSGTHSVATPPAGATTTGIASHVPAPRTSDAPSSLGTQNDRFARAMEQKKAGDLRRAVQTLDSLLHDYPGGQLSESAFVERMKMLEGMDLARARRDAKEYLHRYPQGFARSHAETLVGSSP